MDGNRDQEIRKMHKAIGIANIRNYHYLIPIVDIMYQIKVRLISNLTEIDTRQLEDYFMQGLLDI
jgi:hypothetical protein